MTDIHDSMEFQAHQWGRVKVRALVVVDGELVADCRSERGISLYLSLAYCRKLMAA